MQTALPQNRTPILNDPWTGPARHWRLSIATGETVDTETPRAGRRPSGEEERIAPGGGANPDELTHVERAPHPLINELRTELDKWRRNGRPGVNPGTARLLERWLPSNEAASGSRRQPDAETLPYWCQVEATETAIWLLEAGRQAAPESYETIWQNLKEVNREHNEDIERICLKMATGTGKTWVMAMLIAWWSEREQAGTQPQVLVISPNTTVRDRLQVLTDQTDFMWRAILGRRSTLRQRPRIAIINEQRWTGRQDQYDAVGQKPDAEALRYLRAVLTEEEKAARAETPTEVAARILRGFAPEHPTLVLNDEGHHCWRHEGSRPKGRLGAGERAEQAEDLKIAGRWFGILRTLRDSGRLGPVIDLSATPFWRNPPAGTESPLFPWTVSNTPLIEAIECGLVKIPVVPTRDNAAGVTPEDPVFYRDTYRSIQGLSGTETRSPIKLKREESIPGKLDQLLKWMATDYERAVQRHGSEDGPAPVLIVVADTIDNAGVLWKRIGGTFDAESGSATLGITPLLSNVADGRPRSNPATLLVHSRLDNGTTTGNDQCLKELQAFFPPRTVGGRPVGLAAYKKDIRAIRDTAGIAGEPGQHIRCIVSVLQLSEGWDCKGVSHVVGFRPFESQLLCEQTSGRALRRTTPYLNAEESVAEYAIITGVPFRGMRKQGPGEGEKRKEWAVNRLDEREELEIRFPILENYRLDRPTSLVTLPETLQPYDWQGVARRAPTDTVAEDPHRTTIITIDTASDARIRSVLYAIGRAATELLKNEEEMADPRGKARLFAQILPLVENWLARQGRLPLTDSDIDLLLTEPHRSYVPRQIADACVIGIGDAGGPAPVYEREIPQEGAGTPAAGFRTRLEHRYPRDENHQTVKSILDGAACHSTSEVKVAQQLDRHEEIEAWVRNYKLDWTIPWYNPATTRMHDYEPDFVARLCRERPEDPDDLLVIEFKGAADPDAQYKRETLEEKWTKALNRTAGPGGRLWTPVWITREELIADALDAGVGAARRRRAAHDGQRAA